MNVEWNISQHPVDTKKLPLTCIFGVGKGGFEPPASASRTLRANQAALLPGGLILLDDSGTGPFPLGHGGEQIVRADGADWRAPLPPLLIGS